MSDVSPELLVSLGDVAAEPVDQTGPTSDFVYVDISSIDRETKRIDSAKTIVASEAPSRAKQVLRTGDVVISMTRPNLNAVALVPNHLDGAIGSTGFHVLRSRWIKPEFLFGLVQTDGFIDSMCDVVQGALYPAVRPKDIAAFKFVLQSPSQQTRIIEKLEELLSDLDAGVAELKAARKKLGQYRQSLLKAAVEGALTADWRAAQEVGAGDTALETGSQLLQRILTERRARWEAKQLAKFAEQGKAPPKDWQKKYPEPVQPGTSDLPKLPEEWVWASLDQAVAESLVGLDRGQDQQSEVAEFGYIKMNNVSMNGRADVGKLIRVNASEEEVKKYSVQQNDLLFNTRNSLELVGKVGLVQSLSGVTLYNNNLIRLRFDGVLIPEFAWRQMCAPEFRARMERVKKATTSVAAVYAKDLFPMAVAVPASKEQEEIARVLDMAISAIENQEAAIELALKQSAAQRKNVLKAAFSGQLVPQNPNDEPASVLLDRIRVERAERDKQPKVRKSKQQKEIAAMASKLIDVLVDAGDWLPAQEAFRRCGVADGAETEQIEALYAELRDLDKGGRLAVESVTDEQGRKLHDRLKLLAT